MQVSAAVLTSQNKIVSSGQVFDMNITLDPKGIPISGAQINLVYNKSVLKVNSIKEGNLFKQKGANTFFLGGIIDNSNGTVLNIGSLILARSNISTSGTFIQVNMTFIGSYGNTFINISNSIISDTNSFPVSHEVFNGSISTVQDIPPGPAKPLYITIIKSPDPVSSDNSSQLTVHVSTTGNANVAGSQVNISVTGGSLSSTSGVTDKNGDFMTTYSPPSVSSSSSYTISAIASGTGYANGSGSDIIMVNPSSIPSDIIFSDDFESGTNKWTYSGLWHVSTKRNKSPINGAWYGQESSGNYDTGKTNSGYLSSTAINLVGSTNPKLSFMSWYNTESGISYDKKIVQISTDSGINWIDLKQISDAISTWNLETIDLSSYAGKIIRIRFYLDTVDGLYNNYEGWYLDDLKIENGVTAPGPAKPLSLTIIESPDPVSSGNPSQVIVHVTTTGNANVAGSQVNISVTGGSLSSTSGVTDPNGDFKTSYYPPSVSASTVYTISAKASLTGYANGSGSDTIIVNPSSITSDIIFSDDFESGTNKWTYSGLWHVSTKRYYSAINGAWYGQESSGNYNTGKANSGYMSSEAISLVGSTNKKLTFMSWYYTESGTSYDKKIVQISTDNGVTWIDLKQISDAKSTWNLETIDLSSYVGKIIRIRFYFNTVDGLYNNYEGWYIDNIKIGNT